MGMSWGSSSGVFNTSTAHRNAIQPLLSNLLALVADINGAKRLELPPLKMRFSPSGVTRVSFFRLQSIVAWYAVNQSIPNITSYP